MWPTLPFLLGVAAGTLLARLLGRDYGVAFPPHRPNIYVRVAYDANGARTIVVDPWVAAVKPMDRVAWTLVSSDPDDRLTIQPKDQWPFDGPPNERKGAGQPIRSRQRARGMHGTRCSYNVVLDREGLSVPEIIDPELVIVWDSRSSKY